MVLALFCALWPAPSCASLIWVSNVGTDVTSSFNSDGLLPETLSVSSVAWSLPFQGAPGPYGLLTISTAGFIYLGGLNTSECCVTSTLTDALTALTGGPARIAPAWYDLQPTSAGHVYFNQFSNGTGDEAVITFAGVPSDSSTSDPATFQMQLFSTGEIIFSYMLFDSKSLGSDGALIGLTSAGNASPVAVDLSSVLAGNPVLTSPTSTTSIYDYLQPNSSFDFTGQSIVFLPQTNGGFLVNNGTPEPGTLFPAAGVFLIGAIILFRQKRISKC
jgi:hypothetical protein